jgi:hypothetical protein
MEPIELEHIEKSQEYKFFQGDFTQTSEIETDENKAAKCIMVQEISQYKDSTLAAQILTYIIKGTWAWHSRTSKFIFITDAAGDIFLNLHNEYCGDGSLHFEWMFDKNSFYRTYYKEDQPVALRVAAFYAKYPFFFLKVLWARITALQNLNRYGWLYWIGILLWSLRLLQLRFFSVVNKIKFVSGGFVLSIWLYNCFFYFPTFIGILPLTIFVASVLFYKIEYRHQLSLAYPVIWTSLFLLMITMIPNTLYELFLLPATCAYTVYLSGALINGFIRTDQLASSS